MNKQSPSTNGPLIQQEYPLRKRVYRWILQITFSVPLHDV